MLQGCFAPNEIKHSESISQALYASGQVKSREIALENFTLHYVEGGVESSVAMVFIHGTPGYWQVFGPQLENEFLRSNLKLIAIDRPGWGSSSRDYSDDETSLARQSDLIAPLLKKLKDEGREVILVGHSLGATLAPRLAMAYPEFVDGAVAIAGDLSNDFYRKAWYNDLADVGLVSVLLPRALCYANDEVLALPENLIDMEQYWSNYNSPLWVIQGGKDSLVDPRNAQFAESLKTRSDVTVNYYPDGNHLIHINQSDEVNRILAGVAKHYLTADEVAEVTSAE